MSDLHLSPLPSLAFDAISIPLGFGVDSPQEEAAAFEVPCLDDDGPQPAGSTTGAFEFMPATPEQRRILDEMDALDAVRQAPQPGGLQTPAPDDSAPRTKDGRPLLRGLAQGLAAPA
jgi:hypothetical protein